MNGKNLKYFALGAAIVAAGLGAMAVTIPNTFNAGDVISASGINANFTAVKTAVDALEAPNSVTTAKIAANAVNKDKISDEPGQNQAVNSGTTALDGSIQVVQAVVINAPAAGFVLVSASAEVILSHTTGTASTVQFGVSATGGFTSDQDKTITLPTGAATGAYRQVAAAQKVFAVSAGANTFNLLAQEINGAISIADVTLTAIYIPSSYAPAP